jgi:hypothetical protein
LDGILSKQTVLLTREVDDEYEQELPDHFKHFKQSFLIYFVFDITLDFSLFLALGKPD